MSKNTDSTTSTVKTSKTAKRVKYGFSLTFPDRFTVKQLRQTKEGKFKKAITIRARIYKAIKDGLIEVAGKQAPQKSRRGRQELVYQRVNVTSPVVNIVPVLVPASNQPF